MVLAEKGDRQTDGRGEGEGEGERTTFFFSPCSRSFLVSPLTLRSFSWLTTKRNPTSKTRPVSLE